MIIANIERQFLSDTDLKDIHYYFGKHRPKNAMITHLRVQLALAIAIATLMLTYHALTRLLPGMIASAWTLDLQRSLPAVTLIAALVYIVKLARKRDASYDEFVKNSPGIPVQVGDTHYGVGHGFPETEPGTATP